MLAYVYQVLREDSYAYLSSEEFDNAQSLLATILSKGLANQIKHGLGREYILKNEMLNSPRGKINIVDTMKKTLSSKKVSCECDEFSENSYFNRILKTTAEIMVKSNDVDISIRQSLKKSLLFLQRVDSIPLREIRWNSLVYNRNTVSYKMLLNICYLIINGLLLSQDNAEIKFANFLNEKQMYNLYEKFILEYYKHHYPCLNPSANKIPWQTDDNIIDFLPEMRSDVTLKYEDKVLIIDAKYYEKSMQTYFGKRTIHSNNLYQIFAYVKNRDTTNSGKVNGMLLYAKTNEDIAPNFTYRLSGNIIKVSTLDLNIPFKEISSQLDSIVCNWNEELKNCRIH